MKHNQHLENTTNSGYEFMKIYGITLVAAFILMSVLQFRMDVTESDYPVESMQEETVLPMQNPSPMANADGLIPLNKLKKIFVNLSF